MIHQFYPSNVKRMDRTLALNVDVANKHLRARNAGKTARVCVVQKGGKWELTAPVGAHMRMFSLVS